MYSPALSPYPSGWYFLATTVELPAKTVLTRTLAGRELVLFRTAGGDACAIDAYCPHLGAHFGHGGTVEGESIQCPFHGFCFNTAGACVKTGYGTKPPPKARARVWPLLERHGMIFVYHAMEAEAAGSVDGASLPPAWEIPDIETDGWTQPRMRSLRFRSHVQEIAENSVDIGHLTWIHEYEDVRQLSPLHTEGPHLNARYGMTRPRKTFGKKSGIRTEFEIFQYGLGYARVEVDVVSLGLRTRQFVLARPLNEEEVELSLGMSIRRVENPATIHPLLKLLPKQWLTERIADASIKEFEADVRQDLPIWRNKVYVNPPALAQGDGPVGQYRKWARQFYGEAQKEKVGSE